MRSDRFNVLWPRSGGCGMSLLCTDGADFFATPDGAGMNDKLSRFVLEGR